MNPQLKTKWVNALRSGKYKKTKRELAIRTGSECRYCVLGVLLNEYNPDGWIEEEYITRSTIDPKTEYVVLRRIENPGIHTLSTDVAYELGLDTVPDLWYDGRRVSITDLNDEPEFDLSFEQLADLIEDQL